MGRVGWWFKFEVAMTNQITIVIELSREDGAVSSYMLQRRKKGREALREVNGAA